MIMIGSIKNLRNQTVAVKALILTLAVSVVLAVAGPLVGLFCGTMAVWAAVLAALLCYLGAILALGASAILRQPEQALVALSLGMLARMGIPFGLGLAVHLQGGPLAKAGLVYYLLLFYPITLTTETILSLPPAKRSQRDATDPAGTI